MSRHDQQPRDQLKFVKRLGYWPPRRRKHSHTCPACERTKADIARYAAPILKGYKP